MYTYSCIMAIQHKNAVTLKLGRQTTEAETEEL